MASPRPTIIAGAGIGGLTASLALAQRGFRVIVLEQATRLEETGAGLQLSPNAMHVLSGLGLGARLKADAVVPSAVLIRTARGRRLARVPLGEDAVRRYGAPYWVIHRGDLQTALLGAIREEPAITLKLGITADDFVFHANGLSVGARAGLHAADEPGSALIGADGLWSRLRLRLGNREPPVFRERTAWRALVPAEQVPEPMRSHDVNLWLGKHAHLVHYPVKGGALINIVAIVRDRWSGPGWGTEGARDELLSHYRRRRWHENARALLAVPDRWQKWALHDLPAFRHWGEGAVTLLGDAAHPMLPFLAQGAALAIEDAAVLAASLAQMPDDPATAFRNYEARRRSRTAKVQREARRNSAVYHMSGIPALVRNLVLRTSSGSDLLCRFDWLYDWKP